MIMQSRKTTVICCFRPHPPLRGTLSDRVEGKILFVFLSFRIIIYLRSQAKEAPSRTLLRFSLYHQFADKVAHCRGVVNLYSADKAGGIIKKFCVFFNLVFIGFIELLEFCGYWVL